MEKVPKMKVMHVLKSSIYSGAENVVISIIKSLAGEFELIYVATDGPIREKLEFEKIPFILLKKFNRKNLKRIIDEQNPHIVQAHDFSATVLCASVGGGFRLISQLHYDPPWVRNWNIKTITYRFCERRIETVLTVSDKIVDSMIFANGFKGKWTAVGNPIDTTNIKRMAEQVNTELSGTTCDFIFVGRFVEQKNPQRFIQLIAELRQNGWKTVRAWMLGTGELLQECEALIARLGLQENVSIKGFQKNPYGYIKYAKVLCITSRWEGYGLVVLEANALGVPVLSTRSAGCSELLGDSAEELCDADEQFLEKMHALCENKDVYASWQQRSLERALEFDNKEKYMSVLSCIYRSEVQK